MSVGPTQVAAALADGIHRKVLCAKALCTPELRYFVNQDMNRYGTNEDIYNAFNSAAVLNHNFAFDNWLAPTEVLLGRFMKFSVQLDF